MYKGLFISSTFHLVVIFLGILTLPFVAKKPLNIPPLVSVELIQIADITNIPYAPKARKLIEKIKDKKEKLSSEQAPPKKIKKEKNKEVNLEKKKQEIEKVASKKTPTPENKDNDPLADFIIKEGYDVFRGEENDVLSRFYEAALQFGASSIVRITGDCPLILANESGRGGDLIFLRARGCQTVARGIVKC